MMTPTLRNRKPLPRQARSMLSALSHDIRSPLSSVIALAQLSLNQLAGASAQQPGLETYLLRILDAARDMEAMTNDLLERSRPFARRERFTAQSLASSLHTALSLRSEEKRHQLLLDVSALDAYEFEGERAALLRILLNLLDNAVKYTPDGGRIALRTRILHRKRCSLQAEFIVEDNGEGMSEAFIAQMYQPYARAQSDGEGHGLGLANVRELTQRLGGAIRVRSAPGRGTRFRVQLPLKLARDAASLHGRHFLLAEDNDLSASIAQELLSREGAHVRRAANGEQAVRLFQSAPQGTYDAILMDLRMPVMDGFQAAKAIRRLSRADATSTPIFALTAGAAEEDERQALAAGMNALMHKPLDMALLSDTVAAM